MSSKSLSPTASLLRSSRLFSLPPPLPRPSHESLTSAGFTRFSETATLPHPTHQALATPQSSLSRGDWGLKRPLPLRSTTKTSTPTFRIDAIDTLEHITEYESAADQTLTLQKWQSMNIPISAEVERKGVVRKAYKSVFERHLDNTALPTEGNPTRAERWKYNGPWVAGKTEGEFQAYLKKIRRRKGEFREYLREYVRAQHTADRKREYQAEGRDLAELEKNPVEVDDRLLDDEIKRIRGDPTLGSTLSTVIRDFLDLPALPTRMPSSSSSFSNSTYSRLQEETARMLAKAESGPPKTHPSAGLSYLRTASYVQNHPILGPQAERTPVQARILSPKNLGQSPAQGKLGVGGVVADTSQDSTFDDKNVPGLSYLDIDTEGGGKVWVSPLNATVDAKGRINLRVKRARPEAVGVHTGQIFEPAPTVVDQLPRLGVQGLDVPGRQRTTSSGLGYGLTNNLDPAQQEERRKADRQYTATYEFMKNLASQKGQNAGGLGSTVNEQ